MYTMHQNNKKGNNIPGSRSLHAGLCTEAYGNGSSQVHLQAMAPGVAHDSGRIQTDCGTTAVHTHLHIVTT